MFKELFEAKTSKSDPIFTTDYSNGSDGYWNTAGRILTNIRMYSTGKRAGKTEKQLLGDIYNPPESEYSFKEMVKKGYVTVKDGGYYITKKGSDAIKTASSY